MRQVPLVLIVVWWMSRRFKWNDLRVLSDIHTWRSSSRYLYRFLSVQSKASCLIVHGCLDWLRDSEGNLRWEIFLCFVDQEENFNKSWALCVYFFIKAFPLCTMFMKTIVHKATHTHLSMSDTCFHSTYGRSLKVLMILNLDNIC